MEKLMEKKNKTLKNKELNILGDYFKKCPEFYDYYKKLNKRKKQTNNERTNH